MGEKIYGVDLDGEVTPVMVRDAIIECFLGAHGEILDDMKETGDFKSEEEFEEMKKVDIKLLVKKSFGDVGGDYDNPTKEDIIGVCGKLAEFAANFRKPEIIEKHRGEIMRLVEKLG